MSYETSLVGIVDLLKTYTGTPKIFAENQPVPIAEQKSEWVRWSVRPAVNIDSEVGARMQRIVGALYFQHFVPEDSGTKLAHVFASKVEGFLSHKQHTTSVGVLKFQRAQLKYIGVTQQGFVQHNVTIDYREDATATNAA